MTEERKIFLKQHSIDIDSALARFAGNDKLYLKYLYLFPEDATYESLMASFKANKLWQAQNLLITFSAIVGNLGLSSLHEASKGLLGKIKNGSSGDTIIFVERLESEYSSAARLIKNLRLQEGDCDDGA